jgi:hypothetical protein
MTDVAGRFPKFGKKAAREIPFPCSECGGFTLVRRKSEPDPANARELRLWACSRGCRLRTVSEEKVIGTSEKSYLRANWRNQNSE